MSGLLVLFIAFSAMADDGAYLMRMAGCMDCHTKKADAPFGGGVQLETSFGIFVSPNISPDPRYGIGNWTFEDFKRALREGVSPAGYIYYPAFPYRSYSKISDEDMAKIWAYLQTQEPIQKADRDNQLSFPFNQRWLLKFWKAIFFQSYFGDYETNIKIAQGPFVPDPNHTESWNRGAYLVEALFHCAECHTPRSSLGALELSLWMAGSDIPIGKRKAPNITPDRLTGKGKWSVDDWTRFLSSGISPEGNYPIGEMAQVIQNTSALTAEDRQALIEYIMSLRPIQRDVYDP